MKNFLTIDFESFVHVYDYFPQNQKLSSLQRKNLDNGYVLKACHEILNILHKSNVCATFFIVGEIFEWYPDLIEEIRSFGHEIGWHSHTHQNFTTVKVFNSEYRESKNFITKYQIKILRAPNMIMTEEIYKQAGVLGFQIASSCYGIPEIIEIQGMLEMPVNLISWRKYKLLLPTKFGFKLLTYGFPIGSGYAWGMLGMLMPLIVNWMPKDIKYLMLTLHPWQIVSPNWFKLKIMPSVIRKPIIIPYLINIRSTLIRVLPTLKGSCKIQPDELSFDYNKNFESN